MAELKVSDDEYQALVEAYQQYELYVENIIALYCRKLNDAASYGLKSGAAHDALLQFHAYAVILEGQVKQITDDAIRQCNDYVGDIDAMDKDVY